MFEVPTLHVGTSTRVGPLSVFPIWSDAPQPINPLRARLPRGADIEEHDDEEIDRLTVWNSTWEAFLLPVGTLFGGGLQDRVLTSSVVVGPRVSQHLKVRCVEAGRWNGRKRHRVRDCRAPLAIRGALSGIHPVAVGDPAGSSRSTGPRAVADHLTNGLPGVSVQEEVWRRVADYQPRSAFPTSSLLPALSAPDAVALRSELGHLTPLDGQRGVLIGVGGQPALLEVFDHPAPLADQWESILNSVAVDGARAPLAPTSDASAQDFVSHVSGRRLDRGRRAGLARAARFRDGRVVIDAVFDEHGAGNGPIHLCALNPRHELIAR